MHYFIDQNLKKIVTLQVDQTMQCNAIVVQPLSQKPNKKGRRQPLRLRSIVFYAQSNRITAKRILEILGIQTSSSFIKI